MENEPPFQHSVIRREHLREDLLLPVNRLPFLNLEKLFVSGYGESFFPSGCLPSDNKPYWSFQLQTRGTLEMKLDKVRKLIRPGDLFIISPGKKYHYSVQGDSPVEKKYIMLNHGIIISLLCGQGRLADQFVVPGPLPESISGVFAKVKAMAAEGGENLQNRLSALMYGWLLDLADFCGAGSAGGEMTDLIADINSSIAESHPLEEISRKYGIGVRTLNRLFRRELKCTPHQYIIRTRMRYAEHFLKTLDMPVETAAELCGYKSFAFFSKEFKRLHGMTPSEFRATHSYSE